MNWPLWSFSPKVVEPTIQMTLVTIMLRVLQECQNNLPAMPEQPRKSLNQIKLEQLGFINSIESKEYLEKMKAYQEQMNKYNQTVRRSKEMKEFVTIFKDARKCFGKDTLLIPYDDFEKVLSKYNLVCGLFSSYTGEVPIDKIADITELSRKINGPYRPCYINKLSAISSCEEFSWCKGIPEYIIRFPFVAPFRGVDGLDFYGNSTWNTDKGYRLFSEDSTYLFICAPQKDMKPLKVISSPRNYSDPFICARTRYGILTFTRWGEEANDILIKKYEQLGKIADEL